MVERLGISSSNPDDLWYQEYGHLSSDSLRNPFLLFYFHWGLRPKNIKEVTENKQALSWILEFLTYYVVS